MMDAKAMIDIIILSMGLMVLLFVFSLLDGAIKERKREYNNEKKNRKN